MSYFLEEYLPYGLKNAEERPRCLKFRSATRNKHPRYLKQKKHSKIRLQKCSRRINRKKR